MQIQQLSVFIENKPGRMAEVTEVLAEANIDIRAISVADTRDFGILRVIVDKPKEAVEALVALGYTQGEAAGAVRRVESREDMTAEDVLKASLKYLTFL